MAEPEEPRWPLLVECGDHGRAPYSFCCIHVSEDPAQPWIPLALADDDAREVQADWLCEDCFDVLEAIEDLGLDPWEYLMPLMTMICVNCLPGLQAQGTVFKLPTPDAAQDEDNEDV